MSEDLDLDGLEARVFRAISLCFLSRIDDLNAEIDAAETRAEAAEALATRLQAQLDAAMEGLKTAAVYLDALGDNLLRNDADMLLDVCLSALHPQIPVLVFPSLGQVLLSRWRFS